MRVCVPWLDARRCSLTLPSKVVSAHLRRDHIRLRCSLVMGWWHVLFLHPNWVIHRFLMYLHTIYSDLMESVYKQTQNFCKVLYCLPCLCSFHLLITPFPLKNAYINVRLMHVGLLIREQNGLLHLNPPETAVTNFKNRTGGNITTNHNSHVKLNILDNFILHFNQITFNLSPD